MTTSHNHLDFQAPGILTDELLQMPGFVNQLTEHTLSVSHSPNRALAFFGATALLAHLAGRSFADMHGTRTNLYLIALGETGIGKDAPRRVNRAFADILGLTQTLGDAVASGEGLEELIARQPNLLFQPDEVECLMGSLQGGNKIALGLSDRVRRLYGASAGLYALRGTSGAPQGTVVSHPHLTLFGTGTPEAFYRVLNAQAILNGLYGRCLVLNVPDAYQANEPIERPIPSELVDVGRALVAREAEFAKNGGEVTTVAETTAASMRLHDAADEFMSLRKNLAERGLTAARALVVRMNEKIAKLALIHALSANPTAPIITEDSVNWAISFVTFITKAMLYESQFHLAEGKFDALIKRSLAYLDKCGGHTNRSALLRHLHVDASTLKRLVDTLLMSDLIETEADMSGKIVYSLITSD